MRTRPTESPPIVCAAMWAAPLCLVVIVVYAATNAIPIALQSAYALLSDPAYVEQGTTKLSQVVSSRAIEIEYAARAEWPHYWDPIAEFVRDRVVAKFSGPHWAIGLWSVVAWSVVFAVASFVCIGIAGRRRPSYVMDIPVGVRRRVALVAVGHAARAAVIWSLWISLLVGVLVSLTTTWLTAYSISTFYRSAPNFTRVDAVSVAGRVAIGLGVASCFIVYVMGVSGRYRMRIKEQLPENWRRCGRCNYNITRLVGARCPECGSEGCPPAARDTTSSPRVLRGRRVLAATTGALALPALLAGVIVPGRTGAMLDRTVPKELRLERPEACIRLSVGSGCVIETALGIRRYVIWCERVEGVEVPRWPYQMPIARCRVLAMQTADPKLGPLTLDMVRTGRARMYQSGGLVWVGGSHFWIFDQPAFGMRDELSPGLMARIDVDLNGNPVAFRRIERMEDAGVLGEIMRELDWSAYENMSSDFGIAGPTRYVDPSELSVP